MFEISLEWILPKWIKYDKSIEVLEFWEYFLQIPTNISDKKRRFLAAIEENKTHIRLKTSKDNAF